MAEQAFGKAREAACASAAFQTAQSSKEPAEASLSPRRHILRVSDEQGRNHWKESLNKLWIDSGLDRDRRRRSLRRPAVVDVGQDPVKHGLGLLRGNANLGRRRLQRGARGDTRNNGLDVHYASLPAGFLSSRRQLSSRQIQSSLMVPSALTISTSSISKGLDMAASFAVILAWSGPSQTLFEAKGVARPDPARGQKEKV
ncbi:MAG: hypothetical protein H0X27_07745 [Caulobacteraceae bacterium]|nr:hypothetical protein [Caulobacteraceae bacterium]